MPRERNEGYDVNAIMTKIIIIHKSSEYIEIASGNGIFWFTDVKTFELNKYGFPSYGPN
jgi:hypothetical protein